MDILSERNFMNNKTCCFAGHSSISNQEEIKIRLKNEIINLIEKENVTEFYNGYKGAFDSLCARTVNELKKDYPFIKSFWVLSYMPREKDDYTANLLKLFDESIYPDLENIHPRFAIVKRNEWMVNNSDFLIDYVKHDWDGAFQTLRYAKRKKHISIINLSL